MKKVFILLFMLPIMMGLNSCKGTNTPEPEKDAHEIIGYTYGYTQDANNYIRFYFSTSGQMQLVSCQDGTSSNVPHFTYTISTNLVEVYRDNSTYWSSDMQGTFCLFMTYSPDKDELYWQNGSSYMTLSRFN